MGSLFDNRLVWWCCTPGWRYNVTFIVLCILLFLASVGGHVLVNKIWPRQRPQSCVKVCLIDDHGRANCTLYCNP